MTKGIILVAGGIIITRYSTSVIFEVDGWNLGREWDNMFLRS